MATLEQAVRTLNLLADELRRRRPDVELADEYYRGDHKLTYASDQFQEFFSKRYKRFSDNWCGVVADAPTERLHPIGIRLRGRKTDGGLWDVWLENEAEFLCDLAMIDAIIAKRSYALVWADDDDNPRITWEHPAEAIVGYNPETRERRAGLKLWVDDKVEFATLYLPDQVWKFQRARVNEGRTATGIELPTSSSYGNWTAREGTDQVIDNPLGVVPLVELPNRPRLRGEPLSDIHGTIAMQDAVNLLWSYLFNAADYASFPQRVILGAERPEVPVLDENGQDTGKRRPMDLKKFSVERVVWLEDPGAKVDEWTAANLENYSKVIEVAVGHIAAQTRTPQHYLVGKMANLSADALKAAETGLVKRTEEKAEHFGRSLREVFRLVALAKGDAKLAMAVAGGAVLWNDVESRSEAQRADALLKKKQIGYPLRYLLEQDGKSPTEIDRIMTMVDEEKSDPVLERALNGNPDTPQPQPPRPDEAPPAEE